MNTLLNTLIELLKSYAITAYSANVTGDNARKAEAQEYLNKINEIRLTLAVNAELREIFWQQIEIPAAANVNTTQNLTISQNDKAYVYKRGIANLAATNVFISLLNQGTSAVEITRNPVNWQNLFADIQRAATAEIGQQTLFDFPEALFFDANQSLNLGITGQGETGQIFLHGHTLKDSLTDAAIQDIKNEFIDKETGKTKYLPETQILPLTFQFTDATAGTYAVNANNDNNIFSDKSDKTLLLTHVSTNSTDCRIDKLTDEGRNQTLIERVEMAGVASAFDNRFTTWYELPECHLLRRGDRLKTVVMQGSLISESSETINELKYLAFKGITL